MCEHCGMLMVVDVWALWHAHGGWCVSTVACLWCVMCELCYMLLEGYVWGLLYVIPIGLLPTAYIYHRKLNGLFCTSVYKLILSFLVINSLPAMNICTLAQLKSISFHACWEIMFVGPLFLPNVPIGLYTFFTAWPQERTSLVDTLVWMKNFCMKSKQGPEASRCK